jgi:hypothetical protein
MTLNCSFIVPYREKANADRWEKKLKEDFPDAKVIAINGDAAKGGATSFFDVWAKALPQVKTKYVCLTHDDTEYIGIPDLDKYFKDKVGMIGIAGTTILHKDQPWWFSTERLHGQILSGQVWNTEVDKPNSYSSFGSFGEVVVLDGVCMITTKKILEEVLPTCLKKDYGTWDFYDHIISLELIKRGYKLFTVPIVLLHGSKGGDKRQSFFDSLDKFKDEYLNKTWRVQPNSL